MHIALRDFAQRCARRRDEQVTHADRALQPPFVVDHIEVVGPVSRRAQHAEVIDRLLDAYPFVQGDEPSRHNAAGGFVVVAHQLRDFFAAVQGSQRLQLFGWQQLLDNVRRYVVIDLFEDGWQVLDADSADQIAEFVIFGEFEELPDDVRGEPVEKGDSLVLIEEQNQLSKVRRVEGGDERDELGPLASARQRTGVVQYIAGSNVLCHRRNSFGRFVRLRAGGCAGRAQGRT